MPLIRAACAFLFAACYFLFSAGASAADFSVSYAFDAGDIKDSGKATCEYSSYCNIKSEKLNLSITMDFPDPNHRDVTIRVFGVPGRWGCCYFSDGVENVKRNAWDGLMRLYVYVGHPRRRNEFLQNEPLGILYLQFSDMK